MILSPFVCAAARPREIKYLRHTSKKSCIAINNLGLHLKLAHETHPIIARITCKEIELDSSQDSTVSSD
jgi:hypothetical protein